MCGRYTVIDDDDIAELREIIPGFRGHIANGTLAEARIALPGTSAPILTQHGDFMSADWGFSRKTDKKLVYNARSETLTESAFFSPHLTYGRCIAPAKDYFEWQNDAEFPTKKQKYRFRRDTGPLYLGALFRPSQSGFEYTVITRAAAPELAFIHPRMPLIFTPETAQKWLGRSFDGSLLSCGIDRLVFEPVS